MPSRKPRKASRIVILQGKRYRTIPLQNGAQALVNIADYKKAKNYSWVESRGRVYATVTGKLISLHKFVTGHSGIDHWNGNGLDNRRCNLRLASQSKNLMNSRKKRNSSNRFKGVSHHSSGLWKATIKANGIVIYLGYFKEEKRAAAAYDQAARKYFKDFARVNFPRRGEQGALQ